MIELADKDLALAIELAKQLLATGAAAKPAYEIARAEGYGRKDWTAIYAFFRNRWRRKSPYAERSS